jgi:CRP/FNR family transcriptional regulator, transcriptional activator FtrB
MRPGIDALQTVPVFAALGDDRLEILNEASDLARIGPNEDFLEHGTVPTELYVLTSGYVAYVRRDAGGRDHFTDVVAPCRVIGFAPALLGKPSPMGARTITSVRLIIIPMAVLRSMLHQDANLAECFLDHALQQLLDRANEVIELKLHPATQRLAHYLLSLIDDRSLAPARFVLPFEKRFLAGRLGCTQENLSRALATLRRFGVETHGGVVVIRDVAGMRTYAGYQPAEA